MLYVLRPASGGLSARRTIGGVPMAEKRRISNIEGILNDEVWRAEMVDGMRTWYKS